MNRKGLAHIGVIILIGMIWGAIVTISAQQIHNATKPVATVAK